ncbi:MAG: ATP-binding protein [Hyphomicrobiales bacterium]
MTDKTSLAFELKNNLAELSTLCEKLESIGEALGLPRRSLFEINLALDELFTNIISYGFADQSEHVIRVCISADDNLLTVVLEDDGIPFNPVERQSPELPCDLENCKVGGLGIHLVKNLVDEVVYRRSADKNVLTLKKVIDPS